MPSTTVYGHAAVYPLPATVDASRRLDDLSRLLADPAAPGGGAARVWLTAVTGSSGSASAERHRAVEVRRPVGPTDVRVVILSYDDDRDDLVVVAGDAGSRALLEAVAQMAGVIPEATSATSPPALADVVAALGLLLAAHGTDNPPRVTVLREDDAGPRVGVVTVDTGATGTGAYREAVAEALSRPAPEPADPSTPLLYAGATGYRPLPARPHPLTVTVSGDGITVEVSADPGRPGWAREDIGDLIRHVAVQLAEAPQDASPTSLSLLPPGERARLRALGATPRDPGSDGRCVLDAFADRVAATPDAVAVGDGTTRLTYRQLDERVNRFARVLRAHGVRSGDRVGVCLDRSTDLVTTLLAVLAAGAVQVPLDPRNPGARLAAVAADAGVALVVLDAEAPPVGDKPGLTLAQLAEEAAPRSAAPLSIDLKPEDPAYVIYTSGSTGRPKGVVVPHVNVTRLISATRSDFGLTGSDVWTMFHSPSFDFSIWEIYGCLLTGGRLVVVPYWTTRSPDDFRRLLLDEKVTVLSQTPSAFTQLLELESRKPVGLSVRLVVFGGESLDARVLTRWFDACPPARCRVVNMFGITETTVHVTAQTITRAEALASSRSVGRPLPGWSVRILDPYRRQMPAGWPGEIAVGGDGVAAEYLGRAELTAERFVIDPEDGTRIYLSGDRGRLLPDGRIEHLGRLDSQVKVRGHRVELDEIRSVLLAEPDVTAAAVVLDVPDPSDPAGARLNAYVVRDSAGPTDLRKRVARVLPDYMVPSTVTELSALPLTANGKLDTGRLPAPAEPVSKPVPASGRSSTSGGEPLDVILDVWRSVFGESAGEAHNFFDLGGNSLLAVRLVRSLQSRGIPLVVRDIYRFNTPRELAARVEQPGGT
ncbi:amino acid adenylation domain-containing protein [Micromonospora siamensis]|nr:amino acid adenylation domain-containing protein [Micromonospora siamensis]